MKPSTFIVFFWSLLLGVKMQAQQLVKYGLTRMAEIIVLPPSTPAEAYEKCQVNGRIDDTKLFGPFYQRLDTIGKQIPSLTDIVFAGS